MRESREGWSSTKGRFNLNTGKMILISQMSMYLKIRHLIVDCEIKLECDAKSFYSRSNTFYTLHAANILPID